MSSYLVVGQMSAHLDRHPPRQENLRWQNQGFQENLSRFLSRILLSLPQVASVCRDYYIVQDFKVLSHISFYLANNIDMAIKACASERCDLLRNRKEMEIVLESLDEGCCHVTRKTRDLELVGTCPLVT